MRQLIYVKEIICFDCSDIVPKKLLSLNKVDS